MTRFVFVGAILVRLAAGCGEYDQGEDPEFDPFVRTEAWAVVGRREPDGTTPVDLTVVAEVRKKTYHCSVDGTVLSCGGSSNPNAECHGEPPDFGPQWGEELVERLTIVRVSAEACPLVGDCTWIPAQLVDTKPTSVGYDSDHAYEATFRARMPELFGQCPRVRLEYRREGGPVVTETLKPRSCAPVPVTDAGADAPSSDGSVDAAAQD